MKKLLQKIICFTTREVTDVATSRKEIATYTKLFGFVVKTTYTPVLSDDELSEYLGII